MGGRAPTQEMNKILSLILLAFILVGCSTGRDLAPVVDVSRSYQAPKNFYRVQVGDTLYSIAWAFDLDFRQLAELNNLSPPYRIDVGQYLSIRKNRKSIEKKHVSKKNKLISQKQLIKKWLWPARGKIVARFSPKPYGNKGVNIVGHLGESVHTCASGVVVYSGAGVRGYGNLILIKHNQDYLSAYAFNQRNLVKDGTKVYAGQEIAEMGRNNAGQVLLHFEIRHNGLPVNPLRYLR